MSKFKVFDNVKHRSNLVHYKGVNHIKFGAMLLRFSAELCKFASPTEQPKH